jgi:two-component system chemotaxis response regulator CheB
MSILDEVLTRCDGHFVRFVDDRELIQTGIFVSRPRRHLIVKSKTMRLGAIDGPKRGHWNPSVDELFETAAKSQGDQTVGILLSGTMYDGVEGLLAIQRSGGVTIVQ